MKPTESKGGFSLDGRQLSDERFGFYVAASDRDILSQVSDLLRRRGCIGFADTAGRMHYLVDGRGGSDFAARSILDTAGFTIRLDGEKRRLMSPVLERAIGRALSEAEVPVHLKGCRYLRMMIGMSIREGVDPWPVSKTLYPAAASYYHTTPKRIERDLRYCIRLSGQNIRHMTNSMALHWLRDLTVQYSEELTALERENDAGDRAGPGTEGHGIPHA
jgi:hypothetical protein